MTISSTTIEVSALEWVPDLVAACDLLRFRTWPGDREIMAAIPLPLRDAFERQFWIRFPDVDQHWRSSGWNQYWWSKKVCPVFIHEMPVTFTGARVEIRVWPRGKWIRGEVTWL